MKNYEILNIDSHNYLVIILSVDTTGSYLQTLRDDISRMNGDVRGLYVDFLLRNGLTNRFFKINVRNHTFDDSSIIRCNASRQVNDLSDHFFSQHSQYIRKSIMPSSQKAKYLASISRLLNT